MTDYIEIVKAVGGALAGIVVIGIILSAVFGSAVDVAGVGEQLDEIEPVVDEPVELAVDVSADDDITLSVDATQATAVELDGTGYVEADEPDGWDTGNWSVAVTATPDTGGANFGSESFVVLAPTGEAGGELLVAWDAGQWVAVYDDGAESAVVAVDGTTDQTELVVTFDDTAGELAIHADDASETAVLDAETVAQPDAFRWVGTLDEVRYVDGVLTPAEIDTYQADPVDPLSSADHNARWMFNEIDGSSPKGYEGAASATLINASYTAGVAGPDLVFGEDYNASADPLSVTVLSDGYLDGAPTAFVTVDVRATGFAALLSAVSGTGSAALGLLVVGLLVLVARVVLDEFGGGGFQR